MPQSNGDPVAVNQQNNNPEKISEEKINKGDIQANELFNIIESYVQEYRNNKRGNQRNGIVLAILGIGLSLGATISGIYENPKLSATLAAGAAGIQALAVSYPVGKRASLYRLLRIECSSLAEEIKATKDPTQEQLHTILDTLKAIKLKAADEDSESTLAEAASYYDAQLKKKWEQKDT